MWRIVANSFRSFAKKKSGGGSGLSSSDEKRLGNVLSNPVYSSLLNMKQYKFNDGVVFEGQVNTISWEDRLVGKKSLHEVREMADEEGLDYVLVRVKPITVRVMNYDNFMFKAKRADGGLGKRSKREKGKFFMIDGYSDQETVDRVVKRALETSSKYSNTAVEVTILNRSDPDQLMRSISTAERVEQAIFSLGKGQVSSKREDMEVLFRIALFKRQENKVLVEVEETQLSSENEAEEAAFVNEFLDSEVTDERFEGDLMAKFKEEKETIHRSLPAEMIASLPMGPTKRRLLEENLRKELGTKLASSLLRGQIKPD